MQPDEIKGRFGEVDRELNEIWTSLRSTEAKIQTHLVEISGITRALSRIEGVAEDLRLAILGDGNGRRGFSERIRYLERCEDQRAQNEKDSMKREWQLKLAVWTAVISASVSVAVYVLQHLGGLH